MTEVTENIEENLFKILSSDIFAKRGLPKSRLLYNEDGVYVFTSYDYDLVKKHNFIVIQGKDLPDSEDELNDFFMSLKCAHGNNKGNKFLGEAI